MTDITHIKDRLRDNRRAVINKTAYDQVKELMLANNITPPDDILIPSGGFKRFNKKGGRTGKTPRFYNFAVIHGIAFGCFGCWSENITIPFRENVGRELSSAESMQIDLARQRMEAESKMAKSEALEKSKQDTPIYLNKLESAPNDHPYLTDKKIEPHHALISGSDLVMPLWDIKKELVSYQKINPKGFKKNKYGISTKGLVSVFGGDTDTVYIATGFSTCASIAEATGKTVLSVLGDSNLDGGCEYALEHYPRAKKLLIIDNDEKKSGQKAAEECTTKYQMNYLIIPEFGQDANDYVNAGHDLNLLLNPSTETTDDWLISADEFCSKPAPIKWLVKNWLPENALIMVHGPSGGGKTFLILDMCASITDGSTDWNNHPVKTGSVVYLAGEGHAGLRARLAAIKQSRGLESLGNLYLSKGGCNLNTPEGLGMVVDQINTLPAPPKMIVVDTLHRFLDGDENTAKDTKTMLDACAALTDLYQCAVVLVHHTGNSQEAQHRARGSSAWRGALDIEISVCPKDGNIEVSQQKNKDSELTAPKWFNFDQIALNGWIDDDGDQVTSVVLKSTEPSSTNERKLEAVATAAKEFCDCWAASGMETSAGFPYLTQSALTDHFKSKGLKQSSIKQNLKPGNGRGLIGKLLEHNMIRQHEHGWIMIDQSRVNSMMIRLNSH